MSAATSNQGPITTYLGLAHLHRRPQAGTFAASSRAFLGAVQMQFNGAGMPVVSGATLLGLLTTGNYGLMAGADANGGVYVRAKSPNVRLAFVSGSAEHVSITRSAQNTVDITATYANGTSTGATMVDLLRNTEAARYLVCGKQGSGASLTAATAFAAGHTVPCIEILGVSEREINNSANGSPLALTPDVAFVRNAPGDGTGLLVADTNVPSEGGWAYLIDDSSCSSEPQSDLDLRGPCTGIGRDQSGGSNVVFVDLTAVE